jgi:hypothetical protein
LPPIFLVLFLCDIYLWPPFGGGRCEAYFWPSASSHLGRGPFVLVMQVLLHYLFRVLLPDSEGPKPLAAPPVTGHIVAERRDGLKFFFLQNSGASCALAGTQRRSEKNEQKQQKQAPRETAPKRERESARARRNGVGLLH